MELLIILSLAASIGGNTWQYFHSQDLQQEIEEIVEKGKIRINVNAIQETQKNISMEIPTSGDYFIDTKEIDSLKSLFDREQARYSWEYTFNLGYEYPKSWNWCPEVNEQSGEVTLFVPKVTELALNSPAIDMDLINGSWFDSLREETEDYAKRIINERIEDQRKVILETDSIIKNTNTAYANHLKDILNSTHHGHNPIKKVRLKNVAASPQCSVNQATRMDLTGQSEAPL